MAILLADSDPRWNIVNSETLFDDFFNYTSTGSYWTSVATGTGTTAAGVTGGHSFVNFLTQAAAWDYQGVINTNKFFLPVAGQSMGCEEKVKYTQTTSNTGGTFFGFASTSGVPAGSAVVPSASYSGAIIFKISGDANFYVQSSNGATKTTTRTTSSAADGTHTLRVDMCDKDGLSANVTYTIDGSLAVDSNNNVIVHTLAYASLAAMGVLSLNQAGTSATSNQDVDYITAQKVRTP